MPKAVQVPRLLKTIQAEMKKERWRGAISLLKENSSLVDRHWELLWNLGWCNFKLERFNQAEKYLTKATQIAPEKRNYTCQFGLGMVYLKKKQYRKAERALSHVLRIRESYAARLGLALAYLKQGKTEEAEDTHLKGMRLRPKSCQRYEAYASFLSDVGRETESEKINQKAKDLKRLN